MTLDLSRRERRVVAEADAATREYLAVMDAIAAAGIEPELSLKLTQLGLTSTAPLRR